MNKILPLLIALFLASCDPSPKEANNEPPGPNTQIAEEVQEPGSVDTSQNAQKKGAVAPPPAAAKYHFPYNLSKPNGDFKLSNKLTEISGLSLSPDGQQLVAVNDESGKIFFLNKKNGEIEREVKFGKSGDYEGIESVGDKIYIVESSGDVIKVKDLEKDKLDTKVYNTHLNSKYDVEGLAYDPAHNRLLLACKGKAGDGKDMKGIRAVYGFDLEENKVTEQPVYTIDRKNIKDHFDRGDITQKLVDAFTIDHASDSFAPSGIAIHPKTSDICIVSSIGKLFVVLTPIGEIKYMEKLDASIFKQPEGICFDKDGTLYISTEGKGGKGKLFRFSEN